MAKDPFAQFMSQYEENTQSLDSVVADNTSEASAPKRTPVRKQATAKKEEVTAEQRKAIADARNEHRGRPAVGTVKKKKTRIGFEVDSELAESFKMISYKTGTPFGQLYEEAMSDLITKYSK